MKRLYFLCLLLPFSATAAQMGGFFPTHRFPTDMSFHVGFIQEYGSTNSNYLLTGATSPLTNNHSVSWISNIATLEYQANNHISVGAFFNFQRIALNDNATPSVSPSKWTLGDQSIFAEYRFIDGLGYSLGTSLVAKFPAYQNPTPTEAATQSFALLPGDAQSDVTGFLSGEFWVANYIRLQGDFGFKYRTQDFAPQLVYKGGVSFVNSRIQAGVDLIGLTSIGDGPLAGSAFDSEIEAVRAEFGNSFYSYSGAPSLMILNPHAEFWIGPEYAVSLGWKKTISGSEAAQSSAFNFGFTYRYTERTQATKRRYTEVDINYDQNAGKFDGEIQEEEQRTYEFEPLYYEKPE